MATLKRRLGNLFTHLTGLNLSRKGEGWKLMELETLSRFLSDFRVDCVFDVGANIGQYGARLRQTGYRGLIVSFEPNPSAFAKLQAEAEGDTKWIVKQLALDSEPRTLMFNVMRGHQFSSLHEPDHSQTDAFLGYNVVETQVQVSTAILDELFPVLQKEYRFSRPFLKMDTQGHDLHVVGGASRCLSRFVGLQSELSVTPIYKGGYDFTEALALYRSRGFKLTALVPNNCGHFPDVNEIDCVMYNSEFK
jgi:FkbM family methyltransferase